jgi:hypothetical protein
MEGKPLTIPVIFVLDTEIHYSALTAELASFWLLGIFDSLE